MGRFEAAAHERREQWRPHPWGKRTGSSGVGYQHRSVSDFVADLVAGWSFSGHRRALDPAVEEGWLQQASLGGCARRGRDRLRAPAGAREPEANRAGFAGDDWALAEARSVFRARLETPEAAQALTRVEQASAVRLVALLCFEADQRRCHRDVILAALADRFATEAGSTPRGR